MLPHPGRFQLTFTLNLQGSRFDYTSVSYPLREKQLTIRDNFMQGLQSALDLTAKDINDDMYSLLLQNTKPKEDRVNIYLVVSGALYETMAIHQIYQLS